MKRRHISRSAWSLLALSIVLVGIGFALPRLYPISTVPDHELIALHDERASLVGNNDAALAHLRAQVKTNPAPTWSMGQFTAQVGAGWRVEWQQSAGTNRPVILIRSVARLDEWSDYLRFIKTWTEQPGVVLESLDLIAQGTAQRRRFTSVVLGLRVKLTAGANRDAERDAQSRAPLPVAANHTAATTQKIGPGPPLRQASASGRPDPLGAPAATVPSPATNNP